MQKWPVSGSQPVNQSHPSIPAFETATETVHALWSHPGTHAASMASRSKLLAGEGGAWVVPQSRGPGNFKNLFVHSPNGKKDGLKVIPVSEVAARDEFTGIKSVTRDDMLAALRIPPQLLGIVPQNSGGFGSIRDAAAVWAAMELAPLQTRMTAINEWLGQEVIRFSAFELSPP